MKALKKHSDANLGLFKIASAAFKNAMKGVNREATLEQLKGDANPEPQLPALPAPTSIKKYKDFDDSALAYSDEETHSDDDSAMEVLPKPKSDVPKPAATTTTTTVPAAPKAPPAEKTEKKTD